MSLRELIFAGKSKSRKDFDDFLLTIHKNPEELNYFLFGFCNANGPVAPGHDVKYLAYGLKRLFESGATSYCYGIQHAIAIGNLEIAKYIATLSGDNNIWTDKRILWTACRFYKNNDLARRAIVDFIISTGNANWDHGYYGAYAYTNKQFDLAAEMITRRAEMTSTTTAGCKHIEIPYDELKTLVEHGLSLSIAREFDRFGLVEFVERFRARAFLEVNIYVLPDLAQIVCHQYSLNW